jgi:hypothetical protein
MTALGAVTAEAPLWQWGQRGGIQIEPEAQLADTDALIPTIVQSFLRARLLLWGDFKRGIRRLIA